MASNRPFSARSTWSPRKPPPMPAQKSLYNRPGASPQAIEWWDTHVYRTHLRSPISVPHERLESSTLGLSPRSMKARSMYMAGLNARAMTPSANGYLHFGNRPVSPRSSRPTSPRLVPRNAMQVPDTHPIYKELSDLMKGMKLLDHDGDGFLSPADIVRGLATFSLAANDQQANEKVNATVMKNMKPNGMVGYSNFIKGLSEDEYITKAILATKAEAAAVKMKKEEERAKKAAGPQLRPGVTANELRSAQSLIKDKLLDKHSSLTGAFRSVDKDGSGYISRGELEMCIRSLNLDSIRKDVIDTLCDFIDCENNVDDDEDCGPTDIQYREFARAFGNDDIMAMKPLQAKVEVAKPPPTPPPHNTVPTSVAAVIKTKFKPDQLKAAFDFVDANKDNKLTRAEVRRALSTWGMPLSEDELTELFTACDTDNSGEINYLEFLDMVNKSPPMVQPREMTVLPALRPGVRESDMRHAQKLAKESIIAHHKRLDSAFKHMDSNRSGFITRQDLLKMWEELNLMLLMKREVAENLIDFIDVDDGGSKIDYKEFARVMTADDVMAMAPLKAVAGIQQRTTVGFKSMDMHEGNVNASWHA